MPGDRGRRVLAGLALVVAAQVACGSIWAAYDDFPAGYEVCEHLIFARTIEHEYGQALASDEPGALVRWALANRRIWTRATLVHLALAPAARAWDGDDAWLLASVTGAVSLVVVAVATYAMTLGVAADASPGAARSAGALAVVVVMLAPGCWGTARRFGVDLPLAAAVAAHAALLVRRPPWGSRGATAAHGLLAGMLCLVKAQFAFWSVGLVLSSLATSGLAARAAACRLALFAATAAVGSSLFWAGDLAEIAVVFGWHATALDNPSNDLPEQWTLRAFLYYPIALSRNVGFAAVPLVLTGWVLAWGRVGRHGRTLAIGLAWALGVHTAIALKFGRYFLPAVPLAAALAAVGVQRASTRWRWTLSAVAIAGGVALELAGSIGPVGAWTGLDSEVVHPPVTSTWAQEVREIARAAGAPRGEGPPLVGIEGPDAWDPDDFSRLEWMLRAHVPDALFVRRSPLRSEADLEAYERRVADVWLRVVVVDPEEGVAARADYPGKIRHAYGGQLLPAVRPIPGQPYGSPLRVDAWVRDEPDPR